MTEVQHKLLWQRIRDTLSARGALRAGHSTEMEIAEHAKAALGTELIERFVKDYYQDRNYGDGNSLLSDLEAHQLVSELEALPGIAPIASARPAAVTGLVGVSKARVSTTKRPGNGHLYVDLQQSLPEAVAYGEEEELEKGRHEKAARRRAEEERRARGITEAEAARRVEAERQQREREHREADAAARAEQEKKRRDEEARRQAAEQADRRTRDVAVRKLQEQQQQGDRDQARLKVKEAARKREEEEHQLRARQASGAERQREEDTFGKLAANVAALCAGGDFRAAIPLLEQALQHQVDDVGLLARLGQAHGAVSDHERAARVYEMLAKLVPQTAAYWASHGYHLQRLGRHDGAATSLNEAVKRNPKDGTSWANLGVACGAAQNYTESVKAYTQAVECTPNDPDAWRGLGWSFSRAGDPEKAMRAYRRASELAPRDPAVWHSLGITYHQMRNWTEAERAYRKAIEINPQYQPAWTNLAQILEFRRSKTESVFARARLDALRPPFQRRTVQALLLSIAAAVASIAGAATENPLPFILAIVLFLALVWRLRFSFLQIIIILWLGLPQIVPIIVMSTAVPRQTFSPVHATTFAVAGNPDPHLDRMGSKAEIRAMAMDENEIYQMNVA